MNKLKGCFVTFMTVALAIAATGYWGYNKFILKNQVTPPQLTYPADQSKFLDALIAQKTYLDDWNSGKWKKGLNAIKAQEARQDLESNYYKQWDSIISKIPPIKEWTGILSNIAVGSDGKVSFIIYSPLVINETKYGLSFTSNVDIDKSSTLGMKLRDISNGDTVKFSAKVVTDYFYTVDTGNKIMRKLNSYETHKQYDKIIKIDEHAGDRFGMCAFNFILSDIVIHEVIAKPIDRK